MNRLKKSGSKGVVVSGINDVAVQEIILAINAYLDSEVIDIKQPKLIRQGSASKVSKLISQIKNGEVKGLITIGVNPGLYFT